MEGDKDRTRARVAQIRAEITERIAELNELLVLLDDDDRGNSRPHFTIIKGDRGALALPPLAALGRRPRHPVAVGVAAAIVGAAIAVLVVPTHTNPGGPGNANSYLSIPAMPPPRGIGTPAPSTSTPSAPGAPRTSSSIAPVAASSPLPSAPTASSVPSPIPTPSAPPPTGIPTGTPAPSETPSETCVVKVTVTGLINGCVL